MKQMFRAFLCATVIVCFALLLVSNRYVEIIHEILRVDYLPYRRVKSIHSSLINVSLLSKMKKIVLKFVIFGEDVFIRTDKKNLYIKNIKKIENCVCKTRIMPPCSACGRKV